MNDNTLNILVVSWSFPPTEGPRAIKAEAIVTELLRLGHRVTLVTRQGPEGLRGDVEQGLFDLILMPADEWPTCSIDLHSSQKPLSLSWFARNINGVLYKLFCYPSIGAYYRVRRALRAVRGRQYDLTVSVDGPQPLHWAVADLGTWIADCGDPLLRKLEGNKPAKYFSFVENTFLKTAEVITVPVPQGIEYFEPRFSSKIFTVPHSLLFPADDRLNAPRSDVTQSEFPEFAYAGNLAPYRKQLFEFCKALPTDQTYRFHIFGPNEVVAKALVKEFPHLTERLVLHGVRQRFELLRLLRSFDFLLLFTYQSGFQVPFKIIDYSFSNRPILHFESTREGEERLREFIRGEYRNAFPSADYEIYDSRNTVRQYLRLARY